VRIRFENIRYVSREGDTWQTPFRDTSSRVTAAHHCCNDEAPVVHQPTATTVVFNNTPCSKQTSFPCTGQLKCDGTRPETRFRLSAKRTSPFKSAGASVQSTTGSRSVRISGSNAGYTMSRGSVKGTGYPIHSPVSPPLPLPCVTVCHHISNAVYNAVIPDICGLKLCY